jgi:hypothetical protein
VGGLVEQLQHENLARMAAPDASSLADAIRSLIADPPLAGSAEAAPALWRDMAATLVGKLRAALRR